MWLLKSSPLLFKQVTNKQVTNNPLPLTQHPLTRRGISFLPPHFKPFLVLFLEESIYCAIVVAGAKVGADTICRFGGGSALRFQGRQVGLYLVTVARTAVEACVFCVQILLSKVWVLLHKASELVCGKTTRGHQRQRKHSTKFLKKSPDRLHLKPKPPGC